MEGEHIVGTAVGAYLREMNIERVLLATWSEKLGLRAHSVASSTKDTQDDL